VYTDSVCLSRHPLALLSTFKIKVFYLFLAEIHQTNVKIKKPAYLALLHQENTTSSHSQKGQRTWVYNINNFNKMSQTTNEKRTWGVTALERSVAKNLPLGI
jgi:hypothetical protein